MQRVVTALLILFAVAAPGAAQDGAFDKGQTGLVPEPRAIAKLIDLSDREVNQAGGAKDGFFPEFGNMITGSGWISAGPGYRQHLLGDRALLTASAAVSWKLYKMAQVRFEFPRLAHDHVSVGAQAIYQDMLQINYFGLGNGSRKDNRSGYRLDATDVLGYATVHANDWLSVSGRFGWLHQPELSTMTGWDVSYPNTSEIFTDATAPGLKQQPSYLHSDVSIAADTRDHAGHPTRGGFYRATAALYSDRDHDKYSFRRYELEASHFLPIVEDNWIIALRGFAAFSDTSSGQTVPFYLLPAIGGKNTLRGYYDFRFHDRDAEVFNVESRWGLWRHLDVAVFADAGKVASQVRDLDFHDFKTSYGFGFRVHNREATVGRLDFGHSTEGWRVIVKFSDPFRRSTLSGERTEVIPYVP